MRYLLTFIVLLCNLFCVAQRRSPKCPPAIRSNKQYFRTPTHEKWFLKAEAGVRHSLMYRNDKGRIDDHFSFVSRPQPYISFASGYSFDRHWGMFMAVLVTQTMQGLQFRYGLDGYRRRDNVYQGSIQFRYPLGITYTFPGWKAYAGGAVTYNSFFSTLYSGDAFQTGATSATGYSITWLQGSTYDRWDIGLDASIEKKISKRLHININAAIDPYPSTPSSATATIDISATSSNIYQAQLHPYLYYIGIGLNYRIFSESWDE